MKKRIVLGLLILLCSGISFAQVESEIDSFEEDISTFFDMKILQDRVVVQEVMLNMYKQGDSASFDEGAIPADVILNEQDAASLKKEILSVNNRKKMTQEELEKNLKNLEEDPKNAFKEMLLGMTAERISPEELKTIQRMDKKAPIRMLQMATEAGPSFGSKNVSYVYDETQE